ncbi:MAG: T9SS type A sorting domain-containing protein [Cytophagales bacterium]|nr:T9SS type A sorting domain-containing protein [Cytophagales bacterium]
MKRFTSLLLLLLSIVGYATDDLYGVGTWEFHFPYNKPSHLVTTNNRIYAASENSIFYVDKEDNSVQKLSKKDGLSDIEVGAMAYSSKYNTLIIAYKTGNIDLIINESEILTIDDITRANIVGSKSINHINIHDNIVYLSTDFGLIQLDIVNYEIKDSYRNIGNNGKQIEIHQSSINDHTKEIFILCEEGLLKGSLANNTNLLDYNNWETVFDTTAKISDVVTLNQNTYIYHDFNQKVSYQKEGNWIDFMANDTLATRSINSFLHDENSNSILMSFGDFVFQIKDTNNYDIFHSNTWRPQITQIDQEGIQWTTTISNGIRSNFFGEWQDIFPNGPANNDISKFYHYKGKQYVLRGGYTAPYYTPSFSSPTIYLFEEQDWTKITTGTAFGYTDMTYNPSNQRYYFASFGGGLVYQENDGTYVRLTSEDEGVPLQSLNRISCVELDNDNNLWLVSYLASGEPSLHKLTPDHQWTSYTIDNQYASRFLDMTIDDYGVKWLRIKGTSNSNGLYAYDEEANQGRYLTSSFSRGNLPDESINDVKKDLENRIWVATNNGVAVFDNLRATAGDVQTSEVFLTETQCRLPIVAEQGLPMLLGEVANCIAVDGANRKWIGTNSGLWLFNDNGTQVIQKFDTENSPLPTNEITALDINGETGELFIGTRLGVITYWEGTTTAEPTHEEELKIFPNPVNLANAEVLTIQGLAEGATVKITDITGRVVSEKIALGGTVVWNGFNVNGLAAETGIYLIYSVSEDGEEGFVGKFALIE